MPVNGSTKMRWNPAICVCVLLGNCVCAVSSRNVVHMQQSQSWEESYSQAQHGHNDKNDGIFTKTKEGFAFASYYNDHMVLQGSPKQAVIWGIYPDVGARIILKVGDLEKSYNADVVQGPFKTGGVWTVTLDPVERGGPHSVTAYAEDGASISISDVLFGDVWVCSGQSNMQFSTDQIFNASEELNAASQYKNIRLFTVAMKESPTPLPDLDAIAEVWSLPNATTVGKSPFNYFSAVCWLFGKRLYQQLGYPIGLIDTTWGGTPVEAWSSPDALAKCGVKKAESVPQPRNTIEQDGRFQAPGDNSVLWNAMVYPLLKLTIYGTIWYQGEADAAPPEKMNRYNCTFPAMIDDWRAKFSAANPQTDSTFPFGFVQLAGFQPDMTITTGFSDIRWHQTADYGYTPNARMLKVFMAVSMDLPDFTSPYGSVHPRDKQDVAQRLFMSGMEVAYSDNPSVVQQGPRPDSFLQTQDSVVVSYKSGIGGPIRLASREGFEFCCSWNGVDQCSSKNAWWVPTSIQSSTDTTLTLDGTGCGADQFIVGLRYAWRESPCAFKLCAVYSQTNDLPAPPFVTVKPESAGDKFSYVIDWSKPQMIPN